MDTSRADPGPATVPALIRAERERSTRELLERAEAQFRSSAVRLRACDAHQAAGRAEQFADVARLELDDPRAARLVYGALRDSQASHGLGTMLDGVLTSAMELLHAGLGNIQLVDGATGALTIAAQRGFGPDFLEYFAVVTDDGSACGRAVKRATQVVIADVTADPGFAPHRDIAAASGFRAVQSTPLVSRDGRLVGMLSTHYQRPVTLPDRELRIMRRFGVLIGERLSVLLNGRTAPLDALATRPRVSGR